MTGSILARAADGILSVVLAPDCAACGNPLDRPTAGPICDPCWAGIHPLTPPFCARCGDPLASWRIISVAAATCPRCRRRRPVITRARAVGDYQGTLRHVIHALKYGHRRTVAPRLAALMASRCADVLDGADAVVPVPLHWRRRRSRGFNQAELLARRLGPPWLRAVRRRRATPSQTDLPAARRHANVRDAFAMRRGSDVRGLVVVLVDDVSTTGATLDACARVLLDAGPREVRAVTAARVVGRPR